MSDYKWMGCNVKHSFCMVCAKGLYTTKNSVWKPLHLYTVNWEFFVAWNVLAVVQDYESQNHTKYF